MTKPQDNSQGASVADAKAHTTVQVPDTKVQSDAGSKKSSASDPVDSRILRGAAVAFGRLGYAGASVESILAEAGVSRRTFYKHFRGKEDVFRVLYDKAVSRLQHTVRSAEVPATGGVVARVSRAVEAYVEIHEKAGPLAKVMLLEQFAPGSPLATQRDEAMASFTRMIGNAAKKAGAGELDPLLVTGVVAAINRICVQLAVEAEDGPWETARAKRAIMRLLSALNPRHDVELFE